MKSTTAFHQMVAICYLKGDTVVKQELVKIGCRLIICESLEELFEILRVSSSSDRP